MNLNDYFLRQGENVYIIAEVSQNHDGSLGQAHAFIDAVAKTGVDAIKYQTHIAEAESSPEEPFRIRFSYEDDSRYDYWKRMEFTEQQWSDLKAHAEDRGLEFLSSPFSIEAFELLESIGVSAWKVGSGEAFNRLLLDRMVGTRKPIILSSGMSTYEDIRRQAKYIADAGCKCAVMQCTTNYPTSYSEVGLNVIDELLSWGKFPVGLSDHTATIYPMLAAVARGATLLETHVTLSEYMFGPDVSSSLTIGKLYELVEGVRAIAEMNAHPVDKTAIDDRTRELKRIFSKGIYARSDINKGDIILESCIAVKKPFKGIPADDYMNVMGRRTRCNIKAGDAIEYSMLE